MAEIRVSPEMLRSSSQSLTTMESRFATLMQQIKSDMSAMKNNWEGQAADSFISRFNQLERNFATYSRVMKEYAKFLSDSAQQYEATDSKVKQHNESIVNNLFA